MKHDTRPLLTLSAALLLALAACSDDDNNKPPLDGATPDAGLQDMAAADQAGGDALAPDQSAPDAGNGDGTATTCIAKCGTGFSCSNGSCVQDPPKKDHSTIITQYDGPKTCMGCHPKAMDEVMGTTHYKFQGTLPQNYLYDKQGNPVSQTYTGKNWKLCGFPTAFPQANWVGKLKDDPSTPHIDNPGGCGKCHIGVGIKPYTQSAAAAASQAEKDYNVDCLACHAKGYTRKFYIATTGGQPDLKPDGTPYVFAVPRVDGKLDFSGQLAAAKTVGRTTVESCAGCHAKAGGGAEKVGNVLHSFKRGEGWSADTDVHIKAGLTCSACHSAGNHKLTRAKNNDLSAYDQVRSTSGCIDCHTDKPHKSNATYNKHVAKVACETCHARSKGGVTYKDFSQVTCPSGDCSATSLNTYGVKLTKFPQDFKLTYKWFNGTAEKPIHPRGDKTDGKIYPFKVGTFNQPKDASGNPIPVKWGKVFVAGNMQAAIDTGRTLYQSYLQSFTGTAADYGLPAVPGAFDKFGETEDVFSISHMITKTEALVCKDCHASSGSVLDWSALGLTNPYPL